MEDLVMFLQREPEKCMKIDALARSVLKLSRNTLLVNLRFLDMALSQFELIPVNGQWATDGRSILYDPRRILLLYQAEKEVPVRDYMHMVLHCVYRHMFVNGLVDRALWDLACDIAVEVSITELGLKAAQAKREEMQSADIGKLRKSVGMLTAEKIYRHFQDHRPSDREMARLSALFRGDDHELWYLPNVAVQKTTLKVTDQETGESAEFTYGELVTGKPGQGDEQQGDGQQGDEQGDGRRDDEESDSGRQSEDQNGEGQQEQDDLNGKSSLKGRGPGQNPGQSSGRKPGHGSMKSSGQGSGSASEQNQVQGVGAGSGSLTYLFGEDLETVWKDISERMQTDMETFGKNRGYGAGSMAQNLQAVNREKYDYTAFLKKFATMGEAMKINDDEFDYIFYTYGLDLYKNVPLIEPLEYKDVKRIREFVIAIDTSGSTSGDLVQKFVRKTYNILKNEESFFSKINLHIIQCDAAIQEDVKITNQDEFDEYLKNMKLKGMGGTDFRPVFSYVDELIRNKEFRNLKGLIYFTDGWGVFPQKKPDYDTAFVFLSEDNFNQEVPSWAIKLVLEKEEI